MPPLPFGERIEVRGEFPLTKGGLRGLLLPSLAEAYTYQDVENAYNNAKTQYPNDYIFIEEFNQDGQKGYKVWRRPKNNLPYMTKYTYVGTAVNTTPQTYTYSGYINSCVGDRTKKIWKNSNEVFYKHISGELEYTYCDGSKSTVSLSPESFGVSSPCWYDTRYNNINCAANDVLIATFIPIDQCQDNDGDGYYAYDSVSCPEGNDCNDNDPTINPATIWYKDADNDGYSDGTTSSGCERPDGYKLASELKATSGDCNDNDASKNPEDKDGDGYSTYAGDCNDNDSAINPGAKEECDKKDNNCNGEIDEGACDCSIELRLNSSANAANGNLSHNQELFTSKGTGLSISVTLYYNSLYSGSGHIGTGWSHSYDITLKEFSDGSILFREGNNRRLYSFSNGSYIAQAGDFYPCQKPCPERSRRIRRHLSPHKE